MTDDISKKTIPSPVQFIIAGLSGMAASAMVHPLDLLKFRMQLSGEKGAAVDHKNSFEAIKNILRNEKMSGFYKGLSANLTRQIANTSTRIGAYNTVSEKMNKRGFTSVYHKLLISSGTGALAALISTPADVAVVRMTADGRLPPDKKRNYKHVFDALLRIGKEEGMVGLWRGTVPTVTKAMISNVTQLMSYDYAKTFFKKSYDMKEGLVLHTVSSMISGVVYAVCSCPIDVLKTRIQQQTFVNGKGEYLNMLDASRKLVKSEGITALWKGLPFYYMRIAPATVLLFIYMEQLNYAYKRYFMK
ncbi:mitochondrial 2-oxoglutarate/malate carrier protein-like [Daktulosphaira vitifoliae]|uniref:mitochondrial 2-oxoglutarate/malate carrier protein-like n=1 Tax=Daktulosphaira vitifoliae TaxID=58002 RepID=UPI0021AA30DE|nr:mitochondrial 2-oxoglutarate/malate carrier protein-like [Daktulosphaira vitifoliae]